MTKSFLKILALVAMIIDHIGYALFPNVILLRAIGRISMPIYCFVAADGFKHTSNKEKYITRMMLFAFISEVPFDLFIHNQAIYFGSQNVFFTLALGLIAIYFYDKNKNTPFAMLFPILLGFASMYIKSDYEFLGIIMICLFYILPPTVKNITATILITSLLAITPNIIYLFITNTVSISNLIINSLQICSLIAVIPIVIYNGRKGFHINKYLFYLAYPVHLLALYIIRVLLKI